MDTACKAATWIAFRSIFRRGLVTQTPTRYWPQPLLHQRLASKATKSRQKLPRNHFTSNHAYRAEIQSQKEHQPQNEIPRATSTPKRKSARSQPGSTSLRRVAVEAQRSRGSCIQGKGKTRRVDPEADTKDVTAYCAAETYDLEIAQRVLVREGFEADPLRTRLFPQVLHVQTPNYVERDERTGQEHLRGAGDVFVFPSGCVVAWNVREVAARSLVDRVLLPAAGGSHVDKLEEENLEYLEDSTQESSTIIGDTIVLGTKSTLSSSFSATQEVTSFHSSAELNASNVEENHEIDTVLAKIAFSSALARSTKLAVLENLLSHYFSTTRGIPATLSAGAQLRFTRAFILRKTGELLGLRAQLNLYSELTDSLPDLFWDSPHELGLEGYYEMVGRALDVGVRIKVLNERMDYASEIAAVLRERLSEKHSTGLEWMIIGLITIEVGFGVLHLWRESKERGDRAKTEELLQAYLEQELAKK